MITNPSSNVPQKADYPIALLPFGLIPFWICFILWKLWIPKDDGIYIMSILLASVIARGALHLLLLFRTQKGMKNLGYYTVLLLWSVSTLVIFAAIRTLVPYEIASNYVVMIVVYLVFHFLSLFIRIVSAKKKVTVDIS